MLGLSLVVVALAGAAGLAPAAHGEPKTNLVRYDGNDGDGDYTLGRPWSHTNLTYSIGTHSHELSPERERAALRQAFDLWQNASPLRFTEVASGGDIPINFAPIDGGYDGRSSTILGRTYFPPIGALTLDVDEVWTDADTNVLPPFDVVVVAAHEIGHTIGLSHSTDNSALMSPYYIPHHRFLSPDDVAGVNALYPCASCPGPTTTTTVAPVAPKFSISDATVTEPTRTYSTKATFTVTLSRPADATTRVRYETHDGSATSPADYTHRGGLLTFTRGTTSKTVSITVKRDKVAEPTEAFSVVLGQPSGAGIADGTGAGTIVDPSSGGGGPAPTFSVNDVTVTEPTLGVAKATFTVRLSSPVAASTRVHYETLDGTAVEPGDYYHRSATLYFSSGTTSKTFQVSVRADKLREAIESFSVVLSGATGAGISDATGAATIIDVD